MHKGKHRLEAITAIIYLLNPLMVHALLFIGFGPLHCGAQQLDICHRGVCPLSFEWIFYFREGNFYFVNPAYLCNGESEFDLSSFPCSQDKGHDLDSTNQMQLKEIWLQKREIVCRVATSVQHLQCQCLEAVGLCLQPVQWGVMIDHHLVRDDLGYFAILCFFSLTTVP